MKHAKKTESEKFINVTGWFFLVIAGLSSISALIQLLLSFFPSPIEAMIEKLLPGMSGHVMSTMPSAMLYVLDHRLLISAVSLAFSLPMVWGSWAYLRRREWGRVFFIVFMAVTVVFGVLPPLFPGAFMYQPSTDPMMQQSIETMNRMMHLMLVIMAAVIVIFHGWIIYKLMSPPIRKEFKKEKK